MAGNKVEPTFIAKVWALKVIHTFKMKVHWVHLYYFRITLYLITFLNIFIEERP